MLSHFDAVPLDNGGYELVSGGAITQVMFENEEDKAMFELVLQTSRTPKKTIKALTKKWDKQDVYAFLLKLKEARLISFADETGALSGRISHGYHGLHSSIDEVSKTKIGIVSSSDLKDYLLKQECFANAITIELGQAKKPAKLESFIDELDFAVVDSAGMSHQVLARLNKIAADKNLPWLLCQGLFANSGHVGPLFFTKETGCYECFVARLRSNTTALQSFDRYQQWLIDTDSDPKQAIAPSPSYLNLISSVVAMETEKFLTEYDIAQSVGYLLDVNFRDYSVSSHRLLRQPFCETCSGSFENRAAPWLEEITLEKVG